MSTTTGPLANHNVIITTGIRSNAKNTRIIKSKYTCNTNSTSANSK